MAAWIKSKDYPILWSLEFGNGPYGYYYLMSFNQKRISGAMMKSFFKMIKNYKKIKAILHENLINCFSAQIYLEKLKQIVHGLGKGWVKEK